jgi:flagellar protein FlbD
MLKLTRLNNQVVVVNPDHIESVDATPDTTLKLVGGERIIVRETLEELVDRVVEFRQRIAAHARDFDASGVTGLTRYRSERVRSRSGGGLR